jgi:hypothetical protein
VFFNSYVFWRWFFYAVWQGILLVYLTFYTLGESVDRNGQMGCLQTDGQFIFGTIVIVVNLKVLISSYQYTLPSLVLVLLCIGSYFAIVFSLNFVPRYNMFGEFTHMYVVSNETYVVMLFFATGYLLIDAGLVAANMEIRSWMLKQKEIDL